MRRALIASALVGLAAPAIGVFLVQRRLSLMGDGIGHLAFTGVAIGLLTSSSPLVMALIAAISGALVIELLRAGNRASGEVALAILLYGGIAGGVFVASLSQAPAAGLLSYLFGSVLTVTGGELWAVAALSVSVLAISWALQKQLFAVSFDEEVARAAGLPVRTLNLLVAVTAAVTVVVAMRVVGLLLVAAMMVIPVAVVQPLCSNFRSTVRASLAAGFGASVGGLVLAFYIDSAPGPTIVLVSLVLFMVSAVGSRLRVAR
ncbi:MAG: metal ABC transporter permease [Actinomycetota bacterium]